MENPSLKEIIYGRRSVRRFLDKPVPEALLYQVIDAARLSPSPTNSQPWFFSLLSGEDTHQVAKIIDEEAKGIEVAGYKQIGLESARIAADAPNLIMAWNVKHVSNRLKKITEFTGEKIYRNYERSELICIGCAVENMWLMAHSLGLGMVWLMASLNSMEKCREIFGIDGDIVAYLPIGYPSEESVVKEKKRKSLSDICHFYSAKERTYADR